VYVVVAKAADIAVSPAMVSVQASVPEHPPPRPSGKGGTRAGRCRKRDGCSLRKRCAAGPAALNARRGRGDRTTSGACLGQFDEAQIIHFVIGCIEITVSPVNEKRVPCRKSR
jgi:hypothetical protein